MNKIIDIAPLIIFVALILVLLTSLSKKEDQLESVLIDSTFPEFSIASLKDPKENLSKKDISELPALINVWATWCIACRIEHPFLMDLKKNSVLKIYGLNYKDEREIYNCGEWDWLIILMETLVEKDSDSLIEKTKSDTKKVDKIIDGIRSKLKSNRYID